MVSGPRPADVAVGPTPHFPLNPQKALSFLSRLNAAEQRDDLKHDHILVHPAHEGEKASLEDAFQQKANALFRRSLPEYAIAAYKVPQPHAATKATALSLIHI